MSAISLITMCACVLPPALARSEPPSEQQKYSPLGLALPTTNQQIYMSWELEVCHRAWCGCSANHRALPMWLVLQMFVHFSITTMTGSQSGTQDPAKFAPPANMSVKSWVNTAKIMGAPVAALTAKVHTVFLVRSRGYHDLTSGYLVHALPLYLVL